MKQVRGAATTSACRAGAAVGRRRPAVSYGVAGCDLLPEAGIYSLQGKAPLIAPASLEQKSGSHGSPFPPRTADDVRESTRPQGRRPSGARVLIRRTGGPG